jgi:hypothetical protein
MTLVATSAASDTCALARLAAEAWASASLAFAAARLPPKMSGSQLASKPAWKRLLASLWPDLLRWAEAEAPSVGPSPACCTSAWARACRSAAWALLTLVLASSAWVTRAVRVGSSKRCHQVVSEVGVVWAGPLALPLQVAGTSGSVVAGPATRAALAQADNTSTQDRARARCIWRAANEWGAGGR